MFGDFILSVDPPRIIMHPCRGGIGISELSCTRKYHAPIYHAPSKFFFLTSFFSGHAPKFKKMSFFRSHAPKFQTSFFSGHAPKFRKINFFRSHAPKSPQSIGSSQFALFIIDETLPFLIRKSLSQANYNGSYSNLEILYL